MQVETQTRTTLVNKMVNGHGNGIINGGTANATNTINGVNGNNKNDEDLKKEEEESSDKLLQVSVIVLQQAIDLVNNSLTEDEQLSYASRYIPGSTIGMCLLAYKLPDGVQLDVTLFE